MDKLIASEALYGFCAWLTTRKEKTIMSSVDDAAVIASLVDTYCKTNELEVPRSDWYKKIVFPKED